MPITAAGIHNAQYETVIDSFMLNEVPLRQVYMFILLKTFSTLNVLNNMGM